MTLPQSVLMSLCPMHVLLSPTGHILQSGPTLEKLGQGPLEGRRFLEVFEVYRPSAIETMAHLLEVNGPSLRLRLRSGKRTQLTGVMARDGQGGAVINLSFGISVVDAVRDYALTSKDFAATDLTVEMLYLVEAKSAAMEASRHLNTRLEGARVEAEERAYTDGLTGLRNRRALDQILDRVCRAGRPFALMHLDLDFFKEVNDTYGHAAGDAVLTKVAGEMMAETRANDTAARVGGDEFVFLLPNRISQDRLAAIASRLIERIEEPVIHDGNTCKVSTSIGISLHETGEITPAEIMEQADTALYAAKRAGRAQFHFYQPGDDAPQAGGPAALAGE